MKFKIFSYEKVSSTNDIAMELVKEKGEESGLVFAKMQTKGRGTRGNEWVSLSGNLFATIFFPLRAEYPPFNEFAIINPIILSDVIKNFCENENICLKFPNDIFVNKKKICGILQEVVISNEIKFLIIGIGINIKNNPNIDKGYEATNIFKETKSMPQSKEIIKLIISSYEKFFEELSGYNFDNYKKKAELMALNK